MGIFTIALITRFFASLVGALRVMGMDGTEERHSEGAERPWESHAETTQKIATSLTALAMTLHPPPTESKDERAKRKFLIPHSSFGQVLLFSEIFCIFAKLK